MLFSQQVSKSATSLLFQFNSVVLGRRSHFFLFLGLRGLSLTFFISALFLGWSLWALIRWRLEDKWVCTLHLALAIKTVDLAVNESVEAVLLFLKL